MRNEVAGVRPPIAHFSLPISIREVYDRLYSAYGPQHWWPGDSAFETIAGAILTQSAAWTNVEKALSNLRAAGRLSPQGISALPERDLARLIHPSGYFNAKARKLKAFVSLLDARFGGDPDRMLEAPTSELRATLLEVHGIGPETSDSILLYAANKPIFVIDAYTRRTFSRLGLLPERDSYDGWQALFWERLPPDARLFNEYHAVIVRHAKDVCRKQPLCVRCPLLEICPAASV